MFFTVVVLLIIIIIIIINLSLLALCTLLSFAIICWDRAKPFRLSDFCVAFIVFQYHFLLSTGCRISVCRFLVIARLISLLHLVYKYCFYNLFFLLFSKPWIKEPITTVICRINNQYKTRIVNLKAFSHTSCMTQNAFHPNCSLLFCMLIP